MRWHNPMTHNPKLGAPVLVALADGGMAVAAMVPTKAAPVAGQPAFLGAIGMSWRVAGSAPDAAPLAVVAWGKLPRHPSEPAEPAAACDHA